MNAIVTYFSASGVTEKAAKQLAAEVGADLWEIAPKEPYTAADLDWRDKQSRSTLEMTDPDARPALRDPIPDLSAYDTVYIGFPIWWGVAPRAVNTFVEGAALEGKQVVIFATSGGSRIDKAVEDLRQRYPALVISSDGLK